eukprot:13033585-Alexandrium_andersonii.AAC.1
MGRAPQMVSQRQQRPSGDQTYWPHSMATACGDKAGPTDAAPKAGAGWGPKKRCCIAGGTGTGPSGPAAAAGTSAGAGPRPAQGSGAGAAVARAGGGGLHGTEGHGA